MSPAILEEVRSLQAAGPLTAERVLERAKDPTSALHSEFEWNDALAAHKQRLTVAQTLIIRVRVRIETPASPPRETRVRVRPEPRAQTPAPRAPAPRPAASIALAPPLPLFTPPRPAPAGYTRTPLATALVELQPWRTRYEDVPELAGIMRELKHLEQVVRVYDAVTRARALESDGYDRPTAAARAANEFALDRGEVLALLRAS